MPLVTIEGIDKAGKTTAISALENTFEDTTLTTEPYEDDWTGQHVREVLQGKRDADSFATFSMFMVDHLNHVENLVGPELEKDNLVICDRYIDSRYAYQQESLTELVGEEDTLQWIKQIQEGTYTGTIMPDLTILLDITVEESFRRKGEDPAERFETDSLLSRARENYLELAEENPERFVVVDASQSKDKVVNEVISHVRNLVGENYY